MNIFILHPGKANYPEISAYHSYFSEKFNVTSGTLEQYSFLKDKKNTILWCIMGFYPKKIEAKYVIHDYRSLSVGKFPKTKDKIKKIANTKPNLRIFQNQLMENVMCFTDGTPSILLPMGVPDWIFELTPDPNLPKGTYCYIGEISRERGMDRVIEAFTKNMPTDQTLVLVGHPEETIHEKYKNIENIIFTGKMPQQEALKIVLNCEYTICRIPTRYPYCYQMPTKYLEYAALGKPILCNDCPSNRMAFKEVTSKAFFVADDIFSNFTIQATSKAVQKNNTYPTEISWSNTIKKSNILQKILSAYQNKQKTNHKLTK